MLTLSVRGAQVWWINIIFNPLMLPLVLITFNGEASTGLSWSGIWKPERPKSKKVKNEHEMLNQKAELRAFARGQKNWRTILSGALPRDPQSSMPSWVFA